MNRPSAEDDPEIMEASDVKRLFGPVTLQLLDERRSTKENLQGEIWRAFLFLMLLFLIAEGLLILPPARGQKALTGSAPAKVAPEEMEVVS